MSFWKYRSVSYLKYSFTIWPDYCNVIGWNYYVRHKAETHENRRFFSIVMEFAENAYAYVLKALSRS